MAIQNYEIQVLESGLPKRKNSNTLEIELLSLAVGEEALPIVQGGTGGSAYFDFGSRAIRSSHTPTHANDLVTVAFTEALSAGLLVKDAVRVATTAEIDLSGMPAALDGVTLALGNRFLAKDQVTNPEENGIYVFNGTGEAATRAVDFDGTPSSEVRGGVFTFIQEGATHADEGWVLTTNGEITVGTTELNFTQFSSSISNLIGGDGIDITGNEISVKIDDISVNFDMSGNLQIKDEGVTESKIADNAVTSNKILDNAVTEGKILDNAVTEGKISDGAVATAKIADGAVTGDKLAVDSVSTDKIVNEAVTGAKIAPNAVDENKIASSAFAADGGLSGGNGSAAGVNPGDGIYIDGGNNVAVDYTGEFTNEEGGAITIRQVVKIKSNGAVELADKVDVSNDEIGIVYDATIADNAAGRVYIREGAIIGGFSGLTPGKEYYLDESGGVEQYANITYVEGDAVYLVGKAISASELKYSPMYKFEY
jgi:hypothetical protein